jgi:RHS repeat-associated protein
MLYDPEAEFQEVFNTNGTLTRWLVHRPDLNEECGGLNGTGVIDAVVNFGAPATGVMSDAFGNAVATGTGTTTNWNAVRSLGYGPQPGATPQTLDGMHELSSTLAWRGKYIDPTGFYCLGARTYDPASGTFLSCDPLGHAASMDLYSYCNGDPINGFDADGRFKSGYSSGRNGTISGDAPNSLGFFLGLETQAFYRGTRDKQNEYASDLVTGGAATSEHLKIRGKILEGPSTRDSSF